MCWSLVHLSFQQPGGQQERRRNYPPRYVTKSRGWLDEKIFNAERGVHWRTFPLLLVRFSATCLKIQGSVERKKKRCCTCRAFTHTTIHHCNLTSELFIYIYMSCRLFFLDYLHTHPTGPLPLLFSLQLTTLKVLSHQIFKAFF
jgi:hypothetical protein